MGRQTIQRFAIMICTACLVSLLVSSPWADPAIQIPEPVYKGLRPKTMPFDPERLPDPFLSYLVKQGRQASAVAEEELKKQLAAEAELKRKKEAAAEKLRQLKTPRTELQRLTLSQLILTAIVQAEDMAWAMVRDPKGRGFVLKKGTRIGTNGGVVFEIASAAKKVIIQEPYLEDGLHIKYKSVEMKLPDQVYE